MTLRYSSRWGRRGSGRHVTAGLAGPGLACLSPHPEGHIRYGSGPHFAPRVQSVILLFMCGGVSAMDTFDPKDNKWAGKMLDTVNSNNGKPQLRPVLHCPRVWTRYGQSGIPVCEWFPH